MIGKGRKLFGKGEIVISYRKLCLRPKNLHHIL